MTNRKPIHKKKRYLIPGILILFLIAFRICLPTLVENYVNKTLDNLPSYKGALESVDISLYRGAYTINNLYLNKVKAETEVPFVKFPKTDLSVEWRALLDGSVVAEIIMENPEVIYVTKDHPSAPSDSTSVEPDAEEWTKALTDLLPLKLNHFEVKNGKIGFVDTEADPTIDLAISNFNVTLTNLRNVIEKERTLPSTITARGVSFGGGQLKLDGKMNVIKEIPDIDISFSLEKANAQALNPFTKHYAGIDFEEGTIELFSEVAIADGNLKGYLKPLLIDSKLVGEDDKFFEKLWEGFIGFFKFALKNQSTKTLATEIPLEGNLNNVEAGIWPTVFGIFENAWIDAFQGKTDNSVEFQDAFEVEK